MISVAFSVLFVSFLLLTLIIQFWLASRHIRHILRNRAAVPAQFAEKIGLASHQKAADYTIAKTKLGMVMLLVNALVLVGFTLFGGLQWLSVYLVKLTGPGMWYQISLLVAFTIISSIIEFPFSYYSQFVLEEKFGFNKMTLGLFFTDMIKNAVIGAVLGLPLIWVILTLMEKAGSLWWLYAWAFFIAFQMLIMLIFPVVIAPLFNKFWPLDNEEVRERIESLSKRVSFALKGIFVMDGSKRSGHGNAYFSGFGGAKRIVFYDTLLERLAPNEIEAVLAHELGHFKLKHIIKRMAVMFALSLVFMAMLGFFKDQVWFYTGLGVDPMLLAQNDAMAIILFMLALPVFTFLFSPLSAITSRKHEFEADAFAAKHTHANDLITALVKMYDDNSSTLTPDPLHSAFYDSHPSASVRINHLLAAQ
ncbi:M48 family metallopeptidase [Undibacterium umbellatum]|uniref:M48 family metallopeptidase n=1 Tax=Undibacterium umbellatum TaxID=2762300 RepID=A0ABR6Z9Z4_9BURK|nr:M48 family metallopeptidase [Undibacterium umbellatum]MBC3908587.1 M48 family metallopeptidase [Undibacterium umbellatum]